MPQTVQWQTLTLTSKKILKNLIKMSHKEGSMEWSDALEVLLLSNTITLQIIIKNKTRMMQTTFSEMSQITTKCSLNNQVIRIKKKARTLTFGSLQRQSLQRLWRRRVTGVLQLGASKLQIHLKPHLQVHQLAPELELRHTEGVRTLWEERMEFRLTGEAVEVEVAAEAAVGEEALPMLVPRKMTTGAEITISPG
jgi:hypothetical protein